MRIRKILSVLPPCDLLAEVGCDHAKLTEYALRNGLCKRAVVSDISPVCLEKAKRTLAAYGCVTYLVGDGIVTECDPDCIMICGMGGHTVQSILRAYTGSAKLLLSPQSHVELVRRTLEEKGYALTHDECFEAAGKYYDVLLAEKGEMRLTALETAYGKNYKEKNAALEGRLERMLACLQGNAEANREKIAEITEVLQWQK